MGGEKYLKINKLKKLQLDLKINLKFSNLFYYVFKF